MIRCGAGWRSACSTGLGGCRALTAIATWQEPVGGSRQVSDIGTEPSLATVGPVPYVASSGARVQQRGLRCSSQRVGNLVGQGRGPVNFDTGHDAKDSGADLGGGVPYVAWNENNGNNLEVRVARLRTPPGHWEEPWKGVDAGRGINEDAGKRRRRRYPDRRERSAVRRLGTKVTGSTFVPRVARLGARAPAGPRVGRAVDRVSASSGGSRRPKQGSSPVVASIDDAACVAWTQSTETALGSTMSASRGWSAWQQPWTGVSDTAGRGSATRLTAPLREPSQPGVHRRLPLRGLGGLRRRERGGRPRGPRSNQHVSGADMDAGSRGVSSSDRGSINQSLH